MSEANVANQSRVVRALSAVERMGQRLPDPLTLFFAMSALVVLVSGVFAGVSADVVQRSGDTVTMTVKSLLSFEGLRWMLTSAVDNFIDFAPLGPVLTVMIGIGVAERTGFISMGLKVLVTRVPDALLTATVVFAGVMSSMAADAGYVVLTPLGALLFASVKRHPLAGLAAAYAGVSGGYSANLLITGLDPMLAALTQQAAQSLDPAYTVNAACNYYFMVASTFLVTVIGTVVTTRVVEPMLGEWDPSLGDSPDLSTDAMPGAKETRAFGISMAVGAVLAILLMLLGLIPGAPLHHCVGNLESCDRFKAVDHIQNAETGSGADVEGQRVGGGLLQQVIEAHRMGFRQVHHVQIVPNAGAVMGGVVVAEDPQLLAPSGSHLSDEGKQIVRNAEGVLPDATAGVGAHRVEVAQTGHPPISGAAKRCQHLLHGEFGLGVGMHRRGGHPFVEGELLRFAVDRGGAAEHQGAAVMSVHGRSQDPAAVEVHIPVAQWVGHRFPHGLETGEMNHAIHRAIAAEGPIEHFRVP